MKYEIEFETIGDTYELLSLLDMLISDKSPKKYLANWGGKEQAQVMLNKARQGLIGAIQQERKRIKESEE